MKILTILGTRPEIIRLSRIIPKLDDFCTQVLVDTGQNYDINLRDIFFEELKVRKPDYCLGIGGKTFGAQIGQVLTECEKVITKEKPDRMLVLGDTNSSMAAIIAKRMGVKVYHMEAGNRCYDQRVPEEVNRRIIDHCSDVLMPYTERSRANLLREGIEGQHIFVTGNPIYEVMEYYNPPIVVDRQELDIDRVDILQRLHLERDKYILVTAHREENVDVGERLADIIFACGELYNEYHVPIIFSRHPRTSKRMKEWGMGSNVVTFHEPFGFLDFLTLEKRAKCLISDSGTVSEEGSIMGVPTVIIRDTTERPETLEQGNNILSGIKPRIILDCVRIALSSKPHAPPPEYVVPNVSDTVAKIVLGY